MYCNHDSLWGILCSITGNATEALQKLKMEYTGLCHAELYPPHCWQVSELMLESWGSTRLLIRPHHPAPLPLTLSPFTFHPTLTWWSNSQSSGVYVLLSSPSSEHLPYISSVAALTQVCLGWISATEQHTVPVYQENVDIVWCSGEHAWANAVVVERGRSVRSVAITMPCLPCQNSFFFDSDIKVGFACQHSKCFTESTRQPKGSKGIRNVKKFIKIR